MRKAYGVRGDACEETNVHENRYRSDDIHKAWEGYRRNTSPTSKDSVHGRQQQPHSESDEISMISWSSTVWALPLPAV